MFIDGMSKLMGFICFNVSNIDMLQHWHETNKSDCEPSNWAMLSIGMNSFHFWCWRSETIALPKITTPVCRYDNVFLQIQRSKKIIGIWPNKSKMTKHSGDQPLTQTNVQNPSQKATAALFNLRVWFDFQFDCGFAISRYQMTANSQTQDDSNVFPTDHRWSHMHWP